MTMIYTGTTISFQNGTKFVQAHNSHPKFKEIVELAKKGDFSTAADLVSVKAVVTKAIAGTDATLDGSNVYYKGEVVHSNLARRIVDLAREGFDAKPLLLFLENLMNNPSKRAVDELYGFLEASSLPITDDGHFLAYKSVRSDFTDHHTGTMDNSVGTVVEMQRNQVCEDKDKTCSYGLHFAAHEYASTFGGHDSRMVIVKINPADVVSIPSDYNNQKGRACKYLILEEVGMSDEKLVGVSFVETEEKKETYVPQMDNYEDEEIWRRHIGIITFTGRAKDFPVNRDVSYELERNSNSKTYRGEYFFINYDVANDNLVFAKRGHDGEWARYVTVSDVDDWYIERDLDLVD